MFLEKSIVIGGEEGLPTKIAGCCNPKPGDKVVGYVTRGNRITVHKCSCPLLRVLNEERFVTADWSNQKAMI